MAFPGLKTRAARLAAAAAASLLLVAGAASARAEVKLAEIFSDHMVLQQGMDVPVWGSADKDEEVTVTFAGQTEKAKADDHGHWMVHLHPLKASAEGADLSAAAGSSHADLKDVLVGEVWICSGQSNMEFGIKNAKNSAEEIAKANNPDIRLFTVPKSVEDEPQTTMKGPPEWEHCTPETVTKGGWGGFTAVGYFFGRDLQKDLKVPVGLIHTSWGGTPAEAWTTVEALKADEDFKPILDRTQAEREKKKLNQNSGSTLYNGMIAPIVPFAARGAIWYQGESNAGRAWQYRKLLPAMIKSWREAWNEPDMSFLIVSLANFQQPKKEPGDDAWAELRDAQWATSKLPHNGQALAIDLADAKNPGDIHPKDKQDVGHRLELVALHDDYGKTDVEDSGPVFESMKIEGDKAELKFTHAEGMHAKAEEGGHSPGDKLEGFQIAGEDHHWHWADAKIEGDTVTVSSSDVPKPVAVRYAWATNPIANLYNSADLPAVPFRTDDWKAITLNNK